MNALPHLTPLEVACPKCKVDVAWACKSNTDKPVPYFHTSRVFQSMEKQRREVEQEPTTLVGMIKATPGGANAMRIASENCDLRELLDIANRLIVFAQEIADISCGDDDEWMADFHKFQDGYKKDMEKR